MKTLFKTRTLQSAIVACSLLTTGCEFLAPNANTKIPLNATQNDTDKKTGPTDVQFTQLKNQDDKKPSVKVTSQQFKGTGRFIDPY